MLAITPILLWSMTSSALYKAGSSEHTSTYNPTLLTPAAPMPPPKADLDQIRNGTVEAPINPADWVNGNAGASNSHYIEGQSIPYRMRLSNISIGPHTIDVEWDIKHSSTNAIDYITTVVRTPPQNVVEVINPCRDVSPCTDAVSPTQLTGLNGFTTFDIPAPIPSLNVPPGPDPEPQTSFAALPAADKKFRIYNGVINSITYINNADGNLGDLTASQSSTRIRIGFTASNATVVLAWGGHIASRNDWGFTAGVPNSAGGISGSPYHTRLIAFDGSGGNQDRSLSAGAVSPPAACGIACDNPQDNCTTVCAGSSHVYKSSATQDPANTYSWSLTNNTSGATFGSATNGPTVTVNAGPNGGSYTLNLSVVSVGGTTMCSLIVTVNPTTAISAGPTAGEACEGSVGPVNFSVTATGSNLHYAWKVNGVAAGLDSPNLAYNPSALADGSYPVTVDVTGDCGSASAQTTLLIKQATAIVTPPSSQTACEGAVGPVNFSVVAEGVNLHYQWKVNGVNVGSDSPNLSYDPSALANGAYPVRVDVTGTCGSVFATTTLTIDNGTEIIDPPDNAEACDVSHGPVQFSVTAAGTGTLHYAWTVDDVAAGTDSHTLSYDPFSLNPGAHTVKVVVTGNCGSAEATATLTINGQPSATIALTQECDAFSKLTATPSGGSGSGYGFSWTGPAGGIAADDGICGPTKACVLITKTGTYTVTVSDSKSCSGSQQGQLCLSLSSQGPPPSASKDVVIKPQAANRTPLTRPVTTVFIAGLTQVVLWFL
jgi:hypothetical protein